jgi:hypothetical protein
MEVLSVINQLKNTAVCPYLNGNVEGVAEFERAKLQAANQVSGAGGITITTTSSQVALTPAAYVIYVGSTYEDNRSRTGLRQIVTETFDVVVMIPQADLLGSAAIIQVENVNEQIRRAVLNWVMEPGRTQRPCRQTEDRMIESDNARYWHRFTYSQEVLITDADGYQVQRTPLTKINTTLPSPGITVSTTIPQ